MTRHQHAQQIVPQLRIAPERGGRGRGGQVACAAAVRRRVMESAENATHASRANGRKSRGSLGVGYRSYDG